MRRLCDFVVVNLLQVIRLFIPISTSGLYTLSAVIVTSKTEFIETISLCLKLWLVICASIACKNCTCSHSLSDLTKGEVHWPI